MATRRELAAPGVLTPKGVHMQTITKWEREGLPIAQRGRKGKPSLYSVTDVKAWITAREEQANGPAGPLDPVQERAKKERWQALLAEQTFKARERELLPRLEVEKIWGAEVTAVRARLLVIPTSLSDRLHRAATTDGVAGVERVLHDAIRETLRELANPTRDQVVVKKPAPRRRKKKPTRKAAKAKPRASRTSRL